MREVSFDGGRRFFFGERTHWREEREKGVFFGGRRRGSTEVIFWKGGALCRERKKLQPHSGGNTYTGLPSIGESRGNSHQIGRASCRERV